MKEKTMLHTHTTDALLNLRLEGMANALDEQRSSANYQALSLEDRLAKLVDREVGDRENRRLTRLLKLAKLRNNEPAWVSWRLSSLAWSRAKPGART